MPRRTVLALVVPVLLAMAALPSLASDPVEQDGAVPTAAGEQVHLTWTGQTLPGAEQSGACSPSTSDAHEITLSVPEGTYDEVRVAAQVDVTYEGPLVDIIVTVQKPDGSQQTGDSGFTDIDESLSFGNPEAGTHTILVCAFAGAAPQDYDGALTLTAEAITPGVAGGPTCPAPAETLKFTGDIIDTTRAGGEPITETLADGTLLWGSHAGTTHFYSPAAPDEQTASFIQNYQGQTYQYLSEDNGATWQFVPRTPIEGASSPGQGFSDPVFTVDQAGNVFISEINLANVAVSKSTDGGRSYDTTNVVSFVNSDRQWMAADAEDVLYMTANAVGSGGAFPLPPTFSGHFIAKSLDGGATWIAAENPNPDGIGDIQVDFTDGTVYELQVTDTGDVGMGAFRQIRDQESGFDEGFEVGEIASGAGMTAINRLIDPTFDRDDQGNLYAVWSENGTGAAGRPPGIYYSYSTDQGRTWNQPPVRANADARTAIWPWIAVGAPGQVAISYLQVDAELADNNAETAEPDQGWNVVTAHTQTGLGCGDSALPGWQYSQSSDEPVHYGTICQGGTICQAEAVDRRLGDYFANEIDGDGNVYIAVSDTTNGGAVSLPHVLRQVDGHNFLQEPGGGSLGCNLATDGADAERVSRVDAGTAIGLGVALAGRCAEASNVVVLARDDVFADALSGSGLAGALDAPLLLTRSDGLDDDVAAEIGRLGASQAVLLGGTAALSNAVESDARALGLSITRLAGPERFATAAAIADAVVDARTSAPPYAVVALGARPGGGDAWPDALGSAVLAAHREVPVLLVTPDRVPPVTMEALSNSLGDGGHVVVAGGTAAVGADVIAQLEAAGFTAQRQAGADRYGTSVALVREALREGAGSTLLVLASGESFAGPLVAGPAAVLGGGVMLLVQPDSLSNGEGVADLVAELAPLVNRVLIAGDTVAVSQAVEDEVRALVGSGS